MFDPSARFAAGFMVGHAVDGSLWSSFARFPSNLDVGSSPEGVTSCHPKGKATCRCVRPKSEKGFDAEEDQ